MERPRRRVAPERCSGGRHLPPLEGVGEALRTGALFRPKPSDEAAPGSAGAGGEENRSRARGEGAGEEEEEAFIEVAPGGGVVAGMEAEGAIEA